MISLPEVPALLSPVIILLILELHVTGLLLHALFCARLPVYSNKSARFGRRCDCSLSRVRLSMTPWTAACQASLSFTISRSLLKLMSIESVMPSNHLNLCCPFLLLPSIFLSIWVFSSESVLHIRWPKDWSFSFSTSPCNERSGLISFRIDKFDFLDHPSFDSSIIPVYQEFIFLKI